MTVDEFCKPHPHLYHVAHVSALEQIERHGLLSTQSLVNKIIDSPGERERLISQRRCETVRIDHLEHGTAYLRDQKPLNETCLSRCLDDCLTVTDWYRTLNERVYF